MAKLILQHGRNPADILLPKAVMHQHCVKLFILTDVCEIIVLVQINVLPGAKMLDFCNLYFDGIGARTRGVSNIFIMFFEKILYSFKETYLN